MANAVEKLNTIEIGDIEKVNTLTDANIEDINTLEFAGISFYSRTFTATGDFIVSSGGAVDILVVGGWCKWWSW